eukprot:CAMPEP_0117430722 /NCGR_PEP_ID=MMETSP0758-20121206/10278_1 /TAXON_ID=63605 /ORGANISM="Percolomonas cosmopolitus, Strain AE-1 (ATCC 50343)" /LENGTH=50 /DNA_ID=CAMNT_0005219059 /DNA_START=58 /DNA_END=207 /DNA_ORIENTATION=-
MSEAEIHAKFIEQVSNVTKEDDQKNKEEEVELNDFSCCPFTKDGPKNIQE